MIYRTTLFKIKNTILCCIGISAFLAFAFFNVGLVYRFYTELLPQMTFYQVCICGTIYALFWGLAFAIIMFIFVSIFEDRL